MAAAAAAPQPVSPQVVANAFVTQYYHILHHSPAIVHRFYQEISKLGRPEDDGSMSVTTTMKAINEKILSLNFVDFRAEIMSVDAQESFNGGVQVLVTGYLTGTDNMIHNFSQCFFLAPQDPGFFVLNDIFRYIESSDLPELKRVSVNDVVAPGAQEQSPVPPAVQENHVSDENSQVDEVTVREVDEVTEREVDEVTEREVDEVTEREVDEVTEREVFNPPESEDVPTVEEEVQAPEVVEEVQDDPQLVVESDSKVEEVQKKSYASIVMHLKGSPAPFSSPAPAPRKSPPKSQEQQVNPPPASETNGQIPSPDASDNGNNQEGEAGYSIYIKGLPMTANVSLLENAFKQFGPIRSGGIQVRSNRQQGFCFGFVEFEVPSAVEKALEASPISISGCKAVVEEKRSTNSRGSNRWGRFQSGRGGSGFRNEGMRGRGGYGGGGGGRGGYYRGDSNGGVGGIKGGRTLSGGGGDGYQRADNNGGGRSMNNNNNNNNNNNHRGGMSNGMAPRITATA